MSPPDPFEDRLNALWPAEAWQDVSVLVAVSGGADSVALVRALARLKTGGAGRLAVAHFNHRLRGSESASDESFVVGLCGQLGLACHVGRAEPGALAADAGDGLEAAARAARYDFFRHTAEQQGARYLATAHTADDQAETILHRIVRGTGIGGLSGISRVRTLSPAVSVIRPLLGVRRAELLAYLERLGQSYRQDASNADVRFTRNRIRHELLPHLAEHYNRDVVEALLRLGQLAGEAQAVIAALVDELAGRAVLDEGPRGVRIERAALAGQPRYVVRELFAAVWRRREWPLQAMGFAQWELLAQMAADAACDPCGAKRKQILPGQIVVETSAGVLRLEREP